MRVSTFNYNLGVELLYRNPVHLIKLHMIIIAMCISKDYLFVSIFQFLATVYLIILDPFCFVQELFSQ